MKIAFDLDGTLYDSFPMNFGIHKTIMPKMGYFPASEQAYRRNFQTRDWNKFYKGLGIRDEDISEAVRLFIEENRKIGLPPMISGAGSALNQASDKVGEDNIYVITNEQKERVELRFRRDGLMAHIGRVTSPTQGKAKELYDLAQVDIRPLVYIGDLVSDGEECIEARNMGADNI